MFRNFLTVFILVLLFVLWIFPAYMIYKTGIGEFGMIYLPVVGLTLLFGNMVDKNYFNGRGFKL